MRPRAIALCQLTTVYGPWALYIHPWVCVLCVQNGFEVDTQRLLRKSLITLRKSRCVSGVPCVTPFSDLYLDINTYVFKNL